MTDQEIALLADAVAKAVVKAMRTDAPPAPMIVDVDNLLRNDPPVLEKRGHWTPEKDMADEIGDGLWPTARWAEALKDPLTETVILDRTADGERLKDICKSRMWPYRMVYDWIKDDPVLQQKFANALEACGLSWAQETINIADDADPDYTAHAKLKIDTRQRMAKSLDKQRFGETPQVQINAQSGSLIAILSSLPPLRAPEEIDVTPEAEAIELAQKTTAVPLELRDADAIFTENKEKEAAEKAIERRKDVFI